MNVSTENIILEYFVGNKCIHQMENAYHVHACVNMDCENKKKPTIGFKCVVNINLSA